MTPAGNKTPSRYDRGLKVLLEVAGGERPAVLDSVSDIAPDLVRYTIEFAYGDVYTRPGLTLQQRQFATIAGLTALGHAAPQLRFHTEGALNVGCTRREIVEAMIHVAVCAGFPATLNALTVARSVLSTRAAAGVTEDDLTAPISTAGDRYARGLAALAEVDGEAGARVIASLQDIAPDLARYIIEFAFGDVYCRPGLDLKTREIVTVAACTALGTAQPQLKVHVHGLLNVGGSPDEVIETIMQMAVYAGFPAALNALATARQAISDYSNRGRRTGRG